MVRGVGEPGWGLVRPGLWTAAGRGTGTWGRLRGPQQKCLGRKADADFSGGGAGTGLGCKRWTQKQGGDPKSRFLLLLEERPGEGRKDVL